MCVVRLDEPTFKEWLLGLDTEKFWGWFARGDNATHFKAQSTDPSGIEGRAADFVPSSCAS